MEQAVSTLSENTRLQEPTVIRDVTLLSPGVWTGVDNQKTKYTSENIQEGFDNSNWQDMNLFLDHQDVKGPAAAFWIGFIRNARMHQGELRGDLEIWHPLFAMFIKQAKAQFGVSMTMNGREHFNNMNDYSDYEIHNFQSGSLVDEPGCETSWLPKMLGRGNKNNKTVVAGNVSLEKIKELSKTKVDSDNILSKKSLASDASNSESSDSEENSEEEEKHNCKEVKKMTDENQTQESAEEQKEEVKSEEKEKSESEEKTDSESSTGESEKDSVKELGAKVDKLSADVATLTGLVQKSLAAGDESEEKAEASKDEKSEDDKAEEESDDESDVKKELEETKKELAAARKELDSPDKKTLASGAQPGMSVEDSNAGMLNFLGKNANLI